jgi:glyoxylase-like metal-dependent hydrolase (beta-lactamase superfamily II)
MFDTLSKSPRPAAVLVAVVAAFALSPSHAAAPMAKFQAPGFYRAMLGDVEITVLSDGTVELPVDKLLKQPAEKTNKALRKSFGKSPLETSVNGFLINTGSKLVLIDTGAAGLFGPTLGKLSSSLKAAGYQPEQVDEIYITHMHADHVGGLIANKELAFPNAVVRAGKADADFWLSQANMDKAPADMKGFFQGAMNSINPYVAANKFQPITQDGELVPGITSHASAGHTPGHITYTIESQGRKLVLLGDLMHVAAVQFDNPSVTIAFDIDDKAAGAERKKAFAAAAKAGDLIGAAHLPFPGLGHLQAKGKGYTFVPVNYSVPR